MNYFEKYLKYKRKYLDLKGGDNNCGVITGYGSPNIIQIASKWNETREVSWSQEQHGYYLMHKKRTGRNFGNDCTDMFNHIHLISAYTDTNTNIFMLQFSQKILNNHVKITDEMIDHVKTLKTTAEINTYLRTIDPNSLITHGSNNNKMFSLSGGYNEIFINIYLYYHSLIGEQIRIIHTS
jgi:hypothetical protein